MVKFSCLFDEVAITADDPHILSTTECNPFLSLHSQPQDA